MTLEQVSLLHYSCHHCIKELMRESAHQFSEHSARAGEFWTAELIEDDPPAVKLLLEPKGRLEAENNELYIQSKNKQKTSVLVAEREIIIYIPRSSHLAIECIFQSHRSHDIIFLYVGYHEIGHSATKKYKRQVVAKFGIPLFARKIVNSRNSQKEGATCYR